MNLEKILCIPSKLRTKLSNHFLPHLDLKSFITQAYIWILRRSPDVDGLNHYSQKIKNGTLTRSGVLDALVSSDEFQKRIQFSNMSFSLHETRKRFVRSLPRAQNILDLGGTAQELEVGALVAMGYPYSFGQLIIVDLPIEERHELYAQSQKHQQVKTSLGTVYYRYHSMVDLSAYADNQFDLVYSGQSIEHVPEAQCDIVLREVCRVLKPQGFFCVDTPNAKATRLQQKEFIDPDHKIEYTHAQFSEKLICSGFQIEEAKGMNYLGQSFQSGVFSSQEVAQNTGLFDDIEQCYLLAYRTRKRSPV